MTEQWRSIPAVNDGVLRAIRQKDILIEMSSRKCLVCGEQKHMNEFVSAVNGGSECNTCLAKRSGSSGSSIEKLQKIIQRSAQSVEYVNAGGFGLWPVPMQKKKGVLSGADKKPRKRLAI